MSLLFPESSDSRGSNFRSNNEHLAHRKKSFNPYMHTLKRYMYILYIRKKILVIMNIIYGYFYLNFPYCDNRRIETEKGHKKSFL